MDLNTVIRPEFIVIALALNALGAILKYRTSLPAKLLPLVLLAVALPICAVWGWFTSVHTGGARWADSLLIAGLVHGSVVTALAVFGWDAAYGLFKFGLRKKNSKGGKA